MSRIVAALYDSRTEAEFARSRLVSRVKASSARIIGSDTIGALDGMDFESSARESYREGILAGGCLLVAELPGGLKADRIIGLLEEAIGHTDRREQLNWGDQEHGVHVAVADEGPSTTAADPPQTAPAELKGWANAADRVPSADEHWSGVRVAADPDDQRSRNESDGPAPGARVRSFTHDVPAEEQVSLNHETLEVETRESGRQLGDSELAGLFEDRVIEVVAMREEPVVTKVSVVHEEVVVRKSTRERKQTIRDTVRVTEVEVEDVPGTDAPALFRGSKT